jgi:hypothetical protein
MRVRAIVPSLCLAIALGTIALGCDAGPKQLTPDEIVAAFISQNSEPDRSFHMEWQGTMNMLADPRMGGVPIRVSGSFDLSGDDLSGIVTTGAGLPGGFASSTSYARVGGKSFTRYDGQAWQATDGLPDDGGASMPDFDAIRGLTADAVAYDRAETVDDRPLHLIRILDPAAAMRRAMGVGTRGTFEADPAASELLVYVDSQGVPVGAQARLSAQISMGDPGLGFNVPPVRYQMSFAYQFSAWGSDIAIPAPI